MYFRNPVFESTLTEEDEEASAMFDCYPILEVPKKKLFGTELKRNLKFNVNWKETVPPLQINVSSITHPSILQFVLQNEKEQLYWSESFSKKINVSPESKGQTVNIDIQDMNLQCVDDVETVITTEMIRTLQPYDYLKMNETLESYTAVEQYLQNNRIGKQMLDHGDIKVYFENTSKIIVGQERDINILKLGSHLIINKKKIRGKYPWDILSDLQIEAALVKEKVDIEIRAFGNDITAVGTDSNIQKAEQLIAKFEQQIITKEVKFNPDSCCRLLTDDNGNVNVHVQAYFMQKLISMKGDCHIKICKKNSKMSVFVYSKNEAGGNKAVGIVAGCIVSSTVSLPMEDSLKNEIESHKRKKKLVEIVRTPKKIEFVYTSDADELLSHILKVEKVTEDLSVPLVILHFIENHIKEGMSVEASKCNIQYEIDFNNSLLKLCGNENDVQKFKKLFPGLYKGWVWCEESSDSVLAHKLDLRQIADKNKCSFLPKFGNEIIEDFLLNSKSVVMWKRACSSRKIALVSGFMEDIDVGKKIMFVSDYLFPLHDFKSSKDKLITPSTAGRKIELGQKEEILDGKIVSIGYRKSNLSTELPKTQLRELLEEALENTHSVPKTVAVPVSFLDQSIKLKNILEPVFDVVFASDSWDLFLVCARDDILEEVASQVEELFANHSVRGTYRNLQSDLQFGKGFHKIETMTKIGSLVEAKTDVIVNTVDEQLNLSQGVLSNMILTKAGDKIQEECNERYPQGIKRGQIAFTGAGKLQQNGVNRIFHCALQYFKKTRFTQNVKQMVKQCLSNVDYLGYSSIAFPAFGTGQLKYPVQETAKAMFDAVEEYQYECLSSGIVTVLFVIYEKDNKSCEAYLHEENMQRMLPRPEMFHGRCQDTLTGQVPSLVSIAGDKKYKVNIFVIHEKAIQQLSSSVLHVKLTKHITGQEPKSILKKASALGVNGRNVLEINVGKYDSDSLKQVASFLLQYCVENCVVDISVCVVKEIPLQTDAQINVIWDAVFISASNKETTTLRNVYVAVKDSEQLDVLKSQLNNTGMFASIKNIFSSSFGLSGQPKWVDGKSVMMHVVGMSQDSALKTSKEIEAYLHTIKKDRNTKQLTSQSSVKDQNVSGEKLNTDESETVEDNAVSAEVNQGIINFLKAKEELNDWENYVTKTYNLKTSSKPSGHFTVKGSLSSVLVFEKYLQDNFRDSEESENAEQITENKKSMVPQKSNDKEIKTNSDKLYSDATKEQKESAKEPYDVPSNILLEKTHANNEGLTEKDASYGNAGKEVMSFKIDELTVHLLECDITKIEVNCIINSCRETLDFVDLSRNIADVAGETYKTECRQIKKDYGKLQIGECRSTESGNLLCKKVIHLVSPTWTIGERQTEKLLEMQKTIVGIFDEVNQLGFSSVALPILGTGMEQFPVEFWAPQFIGALRSFAKKGQKKMTIYVVEKDKNKMQSLVSAVHSILTALKTNKGLSSVDKISSSNFVSKQFTFSMNKASVDIYVVKANIENISIDAIVCPEDPLFQGKGAIARTLRKLGGNEFENGIQELTKKTKRRPVTSVEAMEVKSPDLLCKYILFTVVPERNIFYTKSTNQFERDIISSVDNVLETARNHECKGVAIPLFGISENEDEFPTPIPTCCREMVNSILRFLQTHADDIVKRIELVSTDEAVVKTFCAEIEKYSKTKDTL